MRPTNEGETTVKRAWRGVVIAAAWAALAGSAAGQGAQPLEQCAPDAVVSGTLCIDKYEASVWRVPNPRSALVRKIQLGFVTLADLTAAGATPVGASSDDYAPCDDSGRGCTDLYAVSLPGVTPSAYLTWFQAQQACKNARKRLPSNAEWQGAVAGSPDPGPDNGTTDCNTNELTLPSLTGSRSGCVSTRGAHDMTGNLFEWVADWVPRSTGCGSWGPVISPTNDFLCLAGAADSGEPGALIRGAFNFAGGGGPLSILGNNPPSLAYGSLGFRCVR
jgi:hypothetical protein